MAAVETNVLEAHDGYVTKVEAAVDGARRTYELTHKPAQVGDLVRAKESGLDITEGAVKRAVKSDVGVHFYDDVGDWDGWTHDKFDVFAKATPAAPRLHKNRLGVGQLAKVVSAHNFDIGDVVRIVGDDGSNVPYKAERLSDGYINWGIARRFAPYTPQAGDELTVDGVEYTLEARKAAVGEQVIVIQSAMFFEIGQIFEVEKTNFAVPAVGLRNDGNVLDGKYLVLEPKASAKPADFTWISADEDESEDEAESDEITVNHNINVNVNTEIDVESLADEVAELIQRKAERIARAKGAN
jgi:hypothetical protein